MALSGMQWSLEIVLILLLGATLFYALRLERALGVLKRDRATLEELVAGFNGATRQAQQGIERLQETADGAGRQIARQIETAGSLKEDLLFLTERGDRLADRLDHLVRLGRAAAAEPALAGAERTPPHAAAQPRGALAELARALHPEVAAAEGPAEAAADGAEASPRVRSQAERDLLRALRMAR
jgi:hypothetical protein